MLRVLIARLKNIKICLEDFLRRKVLLQLQLIQLLLNFDEVVLRRDQQIVVLLDGVQISDNYVRL